MANNTNETKPVVEIADYLRIISKRRYLIIFATWLCAMSAYVATTQMVPVYETSIKLLINQRSASVDGGVVQTAGESMQSLMVSERLAKTYSDMIEGRAVATKIKSAARLRLPAAQLAGKINAEPIRETQLLKVTVRDTSPPRAQKIANTVGKVFPDIVEQLEGGEDLVPLVRVNIVEPALLPDSPVSPKPAQNVILGLMAGLILSFGMAFVLDFMDTSVKSPAEAEQLLGVPTMGIIPLSKEALERSFAVVSHPTSNFAEAFRSLRTNVQYLNFDNDLKVVAVTSSVPEEGKTTIASNLAAALAKSDAKVLVIDCDLRRPRMREYLRGEAGLGLSGVLAGTADYAGAVIVTDIPNLFVMPAGPIPPNPAELLGSNRMKQVVAEAREKVDYVVIDCPPALLVTDAAVLRPLVDGFLMVVRAGFTSKHTVTQAKASLDRVGADLKGIVLSGVGREHARGGYYYSQGYYGRPAEVRETTAV